MLAPIPIESPEPRPYTPGDTYRIMVSVILENGRPAKSALRVFRANLQPQEIELVERALLAHDIHRCEGWYVINERTGRKVSVVTAPFELPHDYEELDLV